MGAPKVATPDELMRLNAVRTAQVKVETDLNHVAVIRDASGDLAMLSLIQKAIRRAGLKQEYLAELAGVKPSQLSAALNGHGNFSVAWLWSWPAEFWAEFMPLLRAEKETTPEALREQRKERIIAAIDLLLVEVL